MLRRLLVVVGLALGLGLVGCENTSEPPMELGKDYYPLEVGATRVFNVEDKTWRDNRVVSTRTSQLREQLTETYQDAAGKLTYKLVRSSRPTSADPWQVDSVHTLTVNPQNLVLTRSNRRTVELIFPVREGAEWNKFAFISTDTSARLTDINRQFTEVGVPATVGGNSYEKTVTTYDEEEDNIIRFRVTRQVYAKGVGPVLRQRSNLNYCEPDRGCPVGQQYITDGFVHTETLVP